MVFKIESIIFIKISFIFSAFFSPNYAIAEQSNNHKLAFPSQIIKSIDFSSDRVCWVNQKNQLKCMGDNKYSQSLFPQSLGEIKDIKAGLSDKGDMACAINTNDKLKCWKLTEGSFPYTVNYVKSPKQLFVSGDYDGMSCAIQKDNTTKCWLNSPKVIGYNSFNFLETFEVKNTKLLSVSGPLACAIKFDETITCWTTKKLITFITPILDLQNSRSIIVKYNEVCIVDENATYCTIFEASKIFNEYPKIVFRHNYKRKSFEPLNNIQFYYRKKYLTKYKGRNAVFPTVNYICGTQKNTIKCYDQAHARLVFEYEAKKPIKYFDILFKTGNEFRPKKDGLCYISLDNKILCKSLDKSTKENEDLKMLNSLFKRYLQVTQSNHNTPIGDKCFYQSNKRIYCFNYSYDYKTKKIFDLPKSNDIIVTSVLVKNDYTCAKLETKNICWGKVPYKNKYNNSNITEASQDDSIALLNNTKNDRKNFQQTQHCTTKDNSVTCRVPRSLLKEYKILPPANDAISEYEYTIPFNDKLINIKELPQSTSSVTNVCAASNKEVKCWNLLHQINDNYIFNEEKFKSTYLIASGVRYNCKYKNQYVTCISPFYDTVDKDFDHNNNYEIAFSLPPEEKITDYSFFHYDFNSKKLCGQYHNVLIVKKCWNYKSITGVDKNNFDIIKKQSKYSEQYSFLTYDDTFICGIVIVDGSYEAICEGINYSEHSENYVVNYKTNRPWFISSFDGNINERWKVTKTNNFTLEVALKNTCISALDLLYCGTLQIDKIINHINQSIKYLYLNTKVNSSILKFKINGFKKYIPLFYSKALEKINVISESMSYENYTLATQDHHLQNSKINKYLYDYLRKKTKDFILKINSPIAHEKINNFYNDVRLPDQQNITKDIKLTKKSLLLIISAKVNLQLSLVSLLTEVSPGQHRILIDYINEVNALKLEKLNSNFYLEFISQFNILNREFEEKSEYLASSAIEIFNLMNFISSINQDLQKVANSEVAP